MQSQQNQDQDQPDYKTLLANAKQALKLEYHKSAALASQLQAIKTQLEQVQAENKILRESAYEDVIKHFEAQTQAAETLALKTEVRQRFLEANGCKDDQSFDSLWDRIKNKVQIQDGEVRIVAQNGTPQFTLTGTMITLREFIESLKKDPISGKFFITCQN